MKSDFNVGVHALVYLYHKGCVLSSEELADNICTNPARVRKVLAPLKKAGLVDTREGISGGYQALPQGGDISLDQVAKALDSTFVSSSWSSGDLDRECLICSGMGDVMDNLYTRLNGLCTEYLKTVTIAQIEAQLRSSAKKGSTL